MCTVDIPYDGKTKIKDILLWLAKIAKYFEKITTCQYRATEIFVAHLMYAEMSDESKKYMIQARELYIMCKSGEGSENVPFPMKDLPEMYGSLFVADAIFEVKYV